MPSNEKLLSVIAAQGEIARLGLDLGAVMTLVAERVLTLANAAGAALELAEGEEMVYRAVAGRARRSLGLRIRREGSLAGLCVQQGEVLRCDDSEQDPRVDRAACRRVGLRSMIVVPLKHQGQTVGVIKAMAADPGHFGDDDEVVLGLLADVVAAAMFHATRYAADDLYYRATHDSLTDCANRALFMDRLRAYLGQGDRDGQVGAVLVLDMDGLKPINDTLGHRAGDQALVELARRLKLCARMSDTVARLGGDEFAVLLRPIERQGGVSVALERIHRSLAAPCLFEGQAVVLGASIGHALFPDEGVDAEALVERADLQMYEAKRARRAARMSAAALPVASGTA